MSSPMRAEQLATSVRGFLTPHWRRWHRDWGPPHPEVVSQWTCVRSAHFLSAALFEEGLPASLESGVPDTHGPVRRAFGFKTEEGWTSHAWVRCGDLIVDNTADQFGGPEVLVTSGADGRYRAGDTGASILAPSDSAKREVLRLLIDWRQVRRQEGRNGPASPVLSRRGG